MRKSQVLLISGTGCSHAVQVEAIAAIQVAVRPGRFDEEGIEGLGDRERFHGVISGLAHVDSRHPRSCKWISDLFFVASRGQGNGTLSYHCDYMPPSPEGDDN